jgi:hypothetical protein
MNLFTICESLIEHSGKPEGDNCYCNVLLKFVQSNKYKVCFDNHNLIQKRYSELARNTELIKLWIELLLRKKNKMEFVTIGKNKFTNPQELYLEVCVNSFGNKNLLTYSKQYYIDYENFIKRKKVHLIDCEEAKDYVNTPLVKVKAKKKSQVSIGNNSPNYLNEKI